MFAPPKCGADDDPLGDDRYYLDKKGVLDRSKRSTLAEVIDILVSPMIEFRY